MTVKQWLIHLRQWIHSFPFFRDDDHCWVGLAGSEEWDCLICKAHKVGDNDEYLDSSEDSHSGKD